MSRKKTYANRTKGIAARSAINKYAYYVHYTAAGFEKQQSLPSENALSEYAKKTIGTRAQALKTDVPASEKTRYAQAIQMLMGTDSVNKNQWPIFQKELEEILAKEFQESWTSTTRLQRGGRVTANAAQSNRKQTRQVAGRKYVTAEQIGALQETIQRVNEATDNLTRIPKGASQADFELLKIALKGLGTWLNNVKDSDFMKTYAYRVDKKLRAKIDNLVDLLSGKDKTTLEQSDYASKRTLETLNDLLIKCNLAFVGTSVIQGFAGEVVGNAAGLLLKHTTKKKMKKIMLTEAKSLVQQAAYGNRKQNNKGVMGRDVVKIVYSFPSMPEEAVPDLLKHAKKEGNTYILPKVSQQKVDFEVKFNVPTGETVVPISMKNVNLQYDLGLVSGTPLLYLIQDENVKGFLRPYLNVIAARMGDSNNDITSNPDVPDNIEAKEKEQIDAVAALKSRRSDALLATKIIAAYKALSGDVFGRKAAKLFVVNDVYSHKVYVLEIADIINAVLNNLKTNTSTMDKYFNFSKSIDSEQQLILDNMWQSTLHERMKGVLASAHEKKVHVAFTPAFFSADNIGSLIKSGSSVVVG